MNSNLSKRNGACGKQDVPAPENCAMSMALVQAKGLSSRKLCKDDSSWARSKWLAAKARRNWCKGFRYSIIPSFNGGNEATMAHHRNSSSDTATYRIAKLLTKWKCQNNKWCKEVTTTYVKTIGSNTKDLELGSLSSIQRFSSISSIVTGHIRHELISFEMLVNFTKPVANCRVRK